MNEQETNSHSSTKQEDINPLHDSISLGTSTPPRIPLEPEGRSSSPSRIPVSSRQIQTRNQYRQYTNFEHLFLAEKRIREEVRVVQLDESDLHDSSPSHEKASSSRSGTTTSEGKLYPIKLSTDGRIRDHERRFRQSQLLLVSLLENFCKVYEQSPERSKRLFYTLCKTLSQMGMIESADFLEEMWTVRESYKRAFRDLVVQALASFQQEDGRRLRDTAELEKDEIIGDAKVQLLTSSSNGSTPPPLELDFASFFEKKSRLREDFVHIKHLGKGAFGRVSHVRNRLDGRDYAVKQIRLTLMDQDMEMILREVRFHSRIMHPNVVQYFGSWLEHGTSNERKSPMLFDNEQIDSSDDDEDADAAPDNDLSSERVVFQMDSGPDTKESSRKSLVRIGSSFALSRLDSTEARSGLKDWSLYIQMELCQFTLDQWLTQRNKRVLNEQNFSGLSQRDVKQSLCIFSDILKGLVHVHRQNCIHRDLKPKNIFFKSTEDTIIFHDGTGVHVESEHVGHCKIGDFGLATLSDPVFVTEDTPSATRTIGVGTVTYASPEQLEAKAESVYTCASDIYSLGIILLELLCPFGSGMERAITLTNLRKRILPDGFVKNFPKESALILWMTMADPAARPSSSELLELDLFPHSTTVASEDFSPSSMSPTQDISSFIEARSVESRQNSNHIPEPSSLTSSESSMHSCLFKNQIVLVRGELEQTRRILESVQEENRQLKDLVGHLQDKLKQFVET